ncbi:hypothetical protein GEMRC1_006951 [Eukaryota sp. GEM-RC1]
MFHNFLTLHYKVATNQYATGPKDVYTIFTTTMMIALLSYTFNHVFHLINRQSTSFLSQRRRSNVTHNYFFFLFYLFISMYQLCHLKAEPWMWYPTLAMKIPWTENDQAFVKISAIIHNAFYIYGLLYLLLCKRHQEEAGYIAMAIHHFATIFLIFASLFWADQTRIGVLIQFCHNIADIFLNLAKALHHAGKHSSAESSFLIFAFCFLFTRIFWFGYILYSVFGPAACERMTPHYYRRNLFYASPLLILYVLHFLWLIRISKLVRSYFSGGNLSLQLSQIQEKDATQPIQKRSSTVKKKVS